MITDDFKQALNIYENTYSHNELINYLKNGTVAEKQTAAICLDNILNKNDAKILMQNLTGCDGKIREAVSFRLKEFVKINPEYYIEFTDIFLDAIIDINGNICRNTIDALKFMKNQTEFIKEFCNKLTEKTLELAERAKDFDIQEGKYKINKEIFKLYWYLQTIFEFVEFVNSKILFDILNFTKQVTDYTIREKSAKILTKLNDKIFNNLKSELSNDNNYYVRKALK